MTIAIILVFMVIISLALFFYLKRKGNKGDESVSDDQEPPQEEIESLVTSNLLLRRNSVTDPALTAYESLINILVTILERLDAADQDSELSWAVKRMATYYLPEKSIKPYLLLDEAMRQDEGILKSLLENIATMTKEMSDVIDVLNNNNVNDYNLKAKFLKQRFDI